jgi:hypothetical protein
VAIGLCCVAHFATGYVDFNGRGLAELMCTVLYVQLLNPQTLTVESTIDKDVPNTMDFIDFLPYPPSDIMSIMLSFSDNGITRRDWAATVDARSSAGALLLSSPPPVHVASGRLAAKLAKRDPSVLNNSIFNVPPTAQVYPEFMRGT